MLWDSERRCNLGEANGFQASPRLASSEAVLPACLLACRWISDSCRVLASQATAGDSTVAPFALDVQTPARFCKTSSRDCPGSAAGTWARRTARMGSHLSSQREGGREWANESYPTSSLWCNRRQRSSSGLGRGTDPGGGAYLTVKLRCCLCRPVL